MSPMVFINNLMRLDSFSYHFGLCVNSYVSSLGTLIGKCLYFYNYSAGISVSVY